LGWFNWIFCLEERDAKIGNKMINKMKPLSLGEVNELIGDVGERKD